MKPIMNEQELGVKTSAGALARAKSPHGLELTTRYHVVCRDKHGKVIAGNKTQEVAIAQGIEDAIVVETDGTQLVVTKRLDMDLDDPDPNNPARKYAYLDNRAGEVGLAWNPDQMRFDFASGFDFDGMFREFELQDLEVILPDFQPVDESEQPRLDQKAPITCPHCGESFVPE